MVETPVTQPEYDSASIKKWMDSGFSSEETDNEDDSGTDSESEESGEEDGQEYGSETETEESDDDEEINVATIVSPDKRPRRPRNLSARDINDLFAADLDENERKLKNFVSRTIFPDCKFPPDEMTEIELCKLGFKENLFQLPEGASEDDFALYHRDIFRKRINHLRIAAIRKARNHFLGMCNKIFLF